MRCTIHPARESSGYCAGCGSFFCPSCMELCEDGKTYCARCQKKLLRSPRVEEKDREGRLATKLLIKFKNGRELRGATYTLDPDRLGFTMTVIAPSGAAEERYVEWADLKYAAIIESLKGEKSVGVREYMPKGSEVVVTFKDGEVIKGFTLKHYDERQPRFSVIPESRKDNRVSTIIERSAIGSMQLGRIPKAQEMRSLADNGVKRLILHFYWRHPDAIVSLGDLASRFGRAPSAVDRELQEFIREGLVRRMEAAGGVQLRFQPAADPVVRSTVSQMGREIDALYFRKHAAEEPKPPAPEKPAIRWPL